MKVSSESKTLNSLSSHLDRRQMAKTHISASRGWSDSRFDELDDADEDEASFFDFRQLCGQMWYKESEMFD